MPPSKPTPRQRSIHRRLSMGLQVVVAAGLVLSILERSWLNVALIALILLFTALPWILGRSFKIFIPPELELLAIVFVFSSLWLGQVRGYYARFWWWDIALHTSSGFLLGILGFLLVHVLNSDPNVELRMKPGFVALFSFFFSVALGAIWEIVEFTIDMTTGFGMQKSNTDTMRDLIVDSVGAAVIAILGYVWLRKGASSFLERWIDHFIDANPRLFGGRGRDEG